MNVKTALRTTHKAHKPQPLDAANNPDAQLRIDTVCALTGLGKSTIYKLVRQQEFPQPIKRGLRCSRWTSSNISHWLKAQATGAQA